MGPIDTPLTAVPAYTVISFEAAMVPGHLGGPWQFLTGNQSPDLSAQNTGGSFKLRVALPGQGGSHHQQLMFCLCSGFTNGSSNTSQSQSLGKSPIIYQSHFSDGAELIVQGHTTEGNGQDLNTVTVKASFLPYHPALSNMKYTS